MHPALRNGGTAIEFPKFVREIPPMVIARPVDVSPTPLNTEELRRGYSPAAWGQIGVGQVKHGIAPEYWQHPADWDAHPTHFYELSIKPVLSDVLGVGIMTPLWGYNGNVPGDAFFGRENEPFVVRNINNLPHDRSTHLHGGHSPSHSDGSPHFTITPGSARDYYYPNISPRVRDRNLDILERTAQTGEDYMTAAAALNIPIYISKEGPAPQGDDPPGGWPTEADGNPARIQRVLGPLGGVAGDTFDLADSSDTLWYHDHGMDETGPAAYSGLAGVYHLTDHLAEELMRKNIIPSVYPKIGEDANGVAQALDFDIAKRAGPETDYNKYFLHLCIGDKVFNPDGTLFYDTLSHDGQMGDVMVVNGIANPKYTVEKRKYRFSVLNHANARVFAMQLRTADHRMAQPFMQIGYDTWLYPKPITQDFTLQTPAKRVDVIVDFKELADRGIREVYLENILPQIDGRGPRGTADINQLLGDGTILKDGEAGEQIMKFIITDEPVHGGKPDLAITMDTELRPHHRILPEEIVKTRIVSFHRQQGAWKINDVFYDTGVANVTPTTGTAERWILRNNGGGWWHPIHMHMEGHQWQKINGQTPALVDQFNQDTTILGSGDEVEMFMKFRTWIGGFVLHCHTLEHEDMRMMFNMDPRLLPTEAPQQTQNLFP
jgi:FtsP/CotA-like multicopper oxidase with cupredoxin domain